MKRVAPEEIQEPNAYPLNYPDSIILGSHFCRQSLALLGRPISGKLTFLFLAYSAAVIICCLQMIVFLIEEWDSYELRFKALENINLTILCFSILAEFGIYPEKTQLLMKIIDAPIFEYQMPLSENMKKVKLEACRKDKSVQNQFGGLVLVYYSITFVIPVIYGIIAVLFFSDIKFNELPFIYVYWLPVSMDSSLIYFVQLLFQSLHGIVLCVGYTGWFVLFISAIVHTQHEVKILCLYLREMDERLLSENCRFKSLTERKKQFSDELPVSYEELEYQNRTLKLYLSQLCKHHTAIIRTVKTFNENCSSMQYIYNQMICFEICIHMFLYLRIEGVERYQHLITSLVCVLLISNLGIFGQGLIDEGDRLIRELSHCSWVDKPTWFKKSLTFMMMTAIHKPLQIKPIGLFVISLKNVSRVLQAAYSYFNVMRTVKDK